MVIILISLRNLLRQKKRNILLGLCMALGVMILVVANAFSHGISDVLFNRVARYVSGQISVSFYERNMLWCQIFRDKAQLAQRLKINDPRILQLEESVGIFSRAIGNGKADNVMLIGVDTTQTLSAQSRRELEESFKMLEGTFKDLENPNVENPAILSTDKAADLNVKKGDIVRVRFKNIFGQDQAARITVVGIMKISNIFMSGVVFLQLTDAKDLFGYQPWESGALVATLRNPKRDAVPVADELHAMLKPGVARIAGDIRHDGHAAQADIFGFFNRPDARELIKTHAVFVDGNPEEALGKKGVLVSELLARRLNIKPGDIVELAYRKKFKDETFSKEFTVGAVVRLKGAWAERSVLLNEYLFYDMFYANLPADGVAADVAKADPLAPALTTEWVLLPRTKTTDDFKKKMHQLTSKKTRAMVADVATMYENASDILKLEGALNVITLVAVLILFLIILMGVVNTLRMTIRERTREIGTMRAIGMQKTDVRNAFLLETFFLAGFASLVGVFLAFLVMAGVGRMKLDLQDNPLGMFLVDGHIYFLPTVGGIVLNVLLIIVIAVATAYVPARRAANLKAAEAFRHYE